MRGDFLESNISRGDIVKKIYKLALARANDAVSMAFEEELTKEKLKRMDLAALTDFKKLANGTVEMKFLDRAELLALLLKASEGQDGEEGEADLARAISSAAEKLSGREAR